MVTRRDILTGAVGVCAGLGSWIGGSTVADEIWTTTVGYAILRNTTGQQQSFDVQVSRDGTPVFWETYELHPEQAVALDRFEREGTYRVFLRWGEMIRSQQLESGERALAVVLATVGDREIIIRDVPYSSLDPSQRTTDESRNT